MPNKLIYFFILFSFFSFGQFSDENKRYADSLLEVAHKNTDTYKTSLAYLELSEVYSLIDLDSVLFFAKKADEIATQGYKIAVDPIRKKLFNTVIAGANNNIGYAYYNKGDLLNALKYHKKALDIYTKIKDNKNKGQSLNNIGVVYRQLNEYKKALSFFNEALKIYKPVGDEQLIALTYNNLGGIYKMLEMDDKALSCYNQALTIRRKIGDDRGIATTLNNMGALYKKHGDLDTALYFFTNSLKIIEKVGDRLGIAYVSCNIGEIAFLKNNIPLAIKMGQKALTIGEELGALPNIEQASSLLQKVYEKTESWEEAFNMQSLNNLTTLKIKSEEAKKAAIFIEMQFQFDKQKEIDQINNQKKLEISQNQKKIQLVTIYFISILLLLTAIFSILLYKRYHLMRKQKFIIEKQNNERKIMLQEIHHRVKNNFQIISSLLKLQTYKNENPLVQNAFQDAISRIHTMAIVHEIIYKKDALDEVEANTYLEHLVANISRTFDNKKVVVEIDSFKDNLGLEETMPIGIIVNELITNSYKHAFTEENENPRIFIQLKKLDGLYCLYYKDNGIGFNAEITKDTFGIELIETMVEQLSGEFEFIQDKEWSTIIKISFTKNKI